MNKGPEVIQQLSSLIDQQETMTSQPEFAQTYVVLGTNIKKSVNRIKPKQPGDSAWKNFQTIRRFRKKSTARNRFGEFFPYFLVK
ncbi:MAG: hypothetical protein WDM76_11120 [Limisphaerales bacterium]